MTPVTQYQQTKQVNQCNLILHTANLETCVHSSENKLTCSH